MSVVLRSDAVAPGTVYTRALLSGSRYGLDTSDAGRYIRATATAPETSAIGVLELGPQRDTEPATTYTRALLSGSRYGLDTSDAGRYWHATATVEAKPTGTFVCEAETSVEWRLEDPNGSFECDASPSVTWDAPQPSSFWTCDASSTVEWASTPLGSFVCDADIDVSWTGRATGVVRWFCDPETDVRWLHEGGIVKVHCLTADGRFQVEDADFDLTQNYVF